MNIVRFDPFREMAALQERVNRAFGDMSRQYDDDLTTRGSWIPAVDIYQTDNHTLVLKVELPDVALEQRNHLERRRRACGTIEEGSAEITRDGTRIGVAGPGDIVGEIAVLASGRRTA